MTVLSDDAALRSPRLRPLLARTLFVVVAPMLCVGIVGSVMSAAVAAPVAPQPQPQPKGQNVESWALAPTGTDPAQPGSRPTFSYTLAPGATVQDSLTIWNYSNVQLTFHVYATDAINNSAGQFDLIDEGVKPKDAGSWVALQESYVTLPASSKRTLAMTLHVPAKASAGDHTAGIVAASQTPAIDQEGHHIVINRRVGSRLYLRVAGPDNPALVVENLGSSYHPALNPLDGSLDVTYTVRNAGNVRLGAHQTVAISDLFGSVDQRKPQDLEELLPGNAVTRHVHFSGVAATLRLTTDVSLTPFIPHGTGVKVTRTLKKTGATSHAWAIPWTLVIVLILLALAILYARRRRDDGDARPVAAASAPPKVPEPARSS